MRLYVFITGVFCGMAFVPELAVCRPKAGIDSATSSAAARSGRRRAGASGRGRAIQDQTRDSEPRGRAACRGTGSGRWSTLSPSLRQHRGQDGERADHRDADDEDRAGRHRAEALVAGEVHAGHGGHDGEAGDEDGAAGGGGGGLERGLGAAGPPRAPRARGGGRTASSRRRRRGRRAARPRSGCRSTGANWLTHARRGPSSPRTAVRPSSSGRPAATSAPKANEQDDQRDRERDVSALWKSSANSFVDGLARRSPRRTARCAARDGPSARPRWSRGQHRPCPGPGPGSPAISKFTRAG